MDTHYHLQISVYWYAETVIASLGDIFCTGQRKYSEVQVAQIGCTINTFCKIKAFKHRDGGNYSNHKLKNKANILEQSPRLKDQYV